MEESLNRKNMEIQQFMDDLQVFTFYTLSLFCKKGAWFVFHGNSDILKEGSHVFFPRPFDFTLLYHLERIRDDEMEVANIGKIW